jgi:hypothetical protein
MNIEIWKNIKQCWPILADDLVPAAFRPTHAVTEPGAGAEA